jgi:hypothetical protein
VAEQLRSPAGAGCKERDVSENPSAGPVKCNGLVRRFALAYRTDTNWSRESMVRATMVKDVGSR